MNIFQEIFLRPIINLLILIYYGLGSLGIPGALGFSIVLLTISIRILVWPFMNSQLRSAKKMADLKPYLDELKKKHKNDKQALAKAQMDLYKEHGVSPAGGCLPSLIQIPIFIALYQAIINVFPLVDGGHLNYLNSLLYLDWMKFTTPPDANFFGLNLAIKPSQAGPGLLFIPILTGALTLIQSKMMAPSRPVKHYPTDSKKETQEKEGAEDTMAAVQSQMVFMMPLMIGYFAYQFPIGLAIYWNVYTIMGIIQQYFISGWGGLADLATRIKNLKF